jgi:DNA-directed RNA polymerase specialized sigma subunit
MRAKNYLSRAYRLDGKISAKVEQLTRLRSLACSVTSSLREDKVSSVGYNKSALEDSIIKIITAENELNDVIDRLINIKKEISYYIALVVNEDEQLLLELRYICFNTWEQIAVKMHIGIATAYRIHKQALDSFDTILDCQQRCSNG